MKRNNHNMRISMSFELSHFVMKIGYPSLFYLKQFADRLLYMIVLVSQSEEFDDKLKL